MQPPRDSLKRQLELARFDRALEVSESLAHHRALLTTAELGRINNILTGRDIDPWRLNPVNVTLPSGEKETLAVLTDPKVTARNKLHQCTEMAENGQVVEAAVEIYTSLVLSHVFEDANRRTAVLASHYFLNRYGIPVSGMALHEIGLGDVRNPEHIQMLKDTIHQLAKFALRQK